MSLAGSVNDLNDFLYTTGNASILEVAMVVIMVVASKRCLQHSPSPYFKEGIFDALYSSSYKLC